MVLSKRFVFSTDYGSGGSHEKPKLHQHETLVPGQPPGACGVGLRGDGFPGPCQGRLARGIANRLRLRRCGNDRMRLHRWHPSGVMPMRVAPRVSACRRCDRCPKPCLHPPRRRCRILPAPMAEAGRPATAPGPEAAATLDAPAWLSGKPLADNPNDVLRFRELRLPPSPSLHAR